MSYADIFEAVQKGTVDDVKYFIKEEGVDVDVKGKNDDTPLKTASWYGRVEIIEFLISSGANVNAKNKFGVTPLFDAANAEVVKALVSKGADVNAKLTNGSSQTPIHYARNAEVVKALISSGADANVKDTYGRPPLHLVLDLLADRLLHDRAGALDDAGIIDVIEAFVSMGVNINIVDKIGCTELFNLKVKAKNAGEKGSKLAKVIEALVSMGAEEELW